MGWQRDWQCIELIQNKQNKAKLLPWFLFVQQISPIFVDRRLRSMKKDSTVLSGHRGTSSSESHGAHGAHRLVLPQTSETSPVPQCCSARCSQDGQYMSARFKYPSKTTLKLKSPGLRNLSVSLKEMTTLLVQGRKTPPKGHVHKHAAH